MLNVLNCVNIFTKDKHVADSTYRRFLEKSTSQRQKAGRWPPGAGDRAGGVVVQQFPFEKRRKFRGRMAVMAAQQCEGA